MTPSSFSRPRSFASSSPWRFETWNPCRLLTTVAAKLYILGTTVVSTQDVADELVRSRTKALNSVKWMHEHGLVSRRVPSRRAARGFKTLIATGRSIDCCFAAYTAPIPPSPSSSSIWLSASTFTDASDLSSAEVCCETFRCFNVIVQRCAPIPVERHRGIVTRNERRPLTVAVRFWSHNRFGFERRGRRKVAEEPDRT